MDLWQLHIFCKVIDLEGFSKAAASIHLSQPTVSSHIKDLESHFGCKLIDRVEKKAIPTQAGYILYQHAKKILRMRDQIEGIMADFQGKLSGPFHLGGSTIPANFLLPGLIGEFCGKYPDVRISLSVSDTQSIIESVISGAIEVGIVGARVKEKRVAQWELIKDEMMLIVPHTHKWASQQKIGIADLLKEPFILRQMGSGTLRSIQESFSNQGYKSDQLKIIAEMGSTTAIIQAIKQGIGVSILSTIAVKEEIEKGSLVAVAIDGLDLRRSFYLTLRSGRTQSPICQTFMDYLKEAYPALDKPTKSEDQSD